MRSFVPAARALAALFFALSGMSTVAAGDIVVGQVVDYAGLDHDMSRDFVAGARTYFDHVNSRGGVNGHRIVHLVRDGGGDAAKSLVLARELIEKEGADVLFGFVDEAALAPTVQSAAFKSSHIALVAPLSGAAFGTEQDNVFYTRASYVAEARKIVSQFRLQGLERYGVLYLDTEYGRAVSRAVRDELRAAKLTPVLERRLPSDAQVDQEARAMATAHPQVVIVVADTLAMAQFVKTYRPLEPGSLTVGLSMVNHETLLQLDGPQLARGTLLTQVVPNPLRSTSPLLREHIELMKRYRDEPPSHLTLEGFLAAKVLVQALKAAGKEPTRASITAALRSMARVELDDTYVTYLLPTRRDANFVDITFLRGDGTLLH